MSLFPAFSQPQESVSSSNRNTSTGEASTSRPLFPSSSSFPKTETAKDTRTSSFSFSFDVQKHEAKTVPPPELITVFSSSDDDVVVVGTHRSDDDRAARKRKRKEKRKQEKKSRKHHERPSKTKTVVTTGKAKVPPAQDHSTRNPKIIFLRDAGVKAEEAFCLDPHPDVINLTFDATYWKNIPKYLRPPRWVLGPQTKTNRFQQKKTERYFQESKELKSFRSLGGVPLAVPLDVVPFGRNYIPLPESGSEDVPSENVAGSSVDRGEDFFFRDRTAVFNEKLRKEPNNVGLWLDFLRFQDDVARNYYSGGTEKEEQTKLTQNGLLQRKISILDRAISSNPSCTSLQLLRLSLCEDLLPTERLTTEWRDFAFSFPTNPLIWRHYLHFHQCLFSLFSLRRLGALHQKYFSLSRSITDGTFHSHTPFPHHNSHFVYFLSFLSEFWLQTGHQEKGVGLQQAWLELNLNFPLKLNQSIPLKDALVFMEPFWDSGLPRFGERSSLGWHDSIRSAGANKSLNQQTNQPINQPTNQSINQQTNQSIKNSSDSSDSQPVDWSEEEDVLVRTSSSMAELWMKLERFRQEHFLLPYHGTEEVLDPERLVLFDDVRPFLFRFPKSPNGELNSEPNSTVNSEQNSESNSESNSEHLFFLAVCNFLVTLRCPLVRNFSTESRGWQALMSSFEEAPLTYFFSYWTEAHVCAASSDSYSATLFSSYHLSWSDRDSLINGIFEQSTKFFTGIYSTYLSVCWLEFKLHRFVEAKGDSVSLKKDVRTLAKSLLKKAENRNNLLIWEWYAFAEGKMEGAGPSGAGAKILETVLSSSQPKADDLRTTISLARIVRFFVENHLGMNEAAKSTFSAEETAEAQKMAVNILLRFAESQPFLVKKDSTDEDSDDSVTKHRILRGQIAFNHLLQTAEDLDEADTTRVHSDTTRIHSDTTRIHSDTTRVHAFGSRVYAFGSRYCQIALCFALFEYLASGLEAGMSVLRNAIQHSRLNACRGRSDISDPNRESSKSNFDVNDESSQNDFDPNREKSRMDWEILTDASIRLSSYHKKHGTMTSSDFRDVLLSGMRDFPNNPGFLLTFTQSEVSVFISGRLRAYFDQILDDATTTVPWIFAIYSEYERRFRLWKNLRMACDAKLTDEISLTTFKDTGMSNKLRSLFEKAVESRMCRHCPLIWRMYLKFEMDEENLRRAEGVYFRAMQSCPWAKSVYMDAIKYFPHRIQEILDVMQEKELRIVAPFEEVELLMKSKDLSNRAETV